MSNFFNVNGFELKGLRKHQGHEGEDLLQGSIYYRGKKVGFFSDGDWGSCQRIEFNSPDIEKIWGEEDKRSTAYFNEITKNSSRRLDALELIELLVILKQSYTPNFRKLFEEGNASFVLVFEDNEYYKCVCGTAIVPIGKTLAHEENQQVVTLATNGETDLYIGF